MISVECGAVGHLEGRPLQAWETVPKVSGEFRDGLLAAVPALRAFAFSLVGCPDRADDLVQETLLKAWAHHTSFRPGTKLRSWLFRILSNEFYTSVRRKKREIEDIDGALANNIGTPPNQPGYLAMSLMREAIMQLPVSLREPLLLVVAIDSSYEEAAEICHVPLGTIKSRLRRARISLAKKMGMDRLDDFGPDAMAHAAIEHRPPGAGRLWMMD